MSTKIIPFNKNFHKSTGSNRYELKAQISVYISRNNDSCLLYTSDAADERSTMIDMILIGLLQTIFLIKEYMKF